jgi:hypothetical protein
MAEQTTPKSDPGSQEPPQLPPEVLATDDTSRDGDGRVDLPSGDRARRRVHRAFRHRMQAYETVLYNEAAAAKVADEATEEAEFAVGELEAEFHSFDPSRKRRGHLDLAVLGATLLALLDVGPAWWAAEAVGGNQLETGIVTVLFVAGLAGFAALIGHFQHERRRRSMTFAVLAAAVLVLVETGLRLNFLITTSDLDTRSTITEAATLGLITAGLLWMSYVILARAESIALYRMRIETLALEQEARRLRTEATLVSTQREHEGEALRVLRFSTRGTMPPLVVRLYERVRELAHRRPPAAPTSEEDFPQVR